MFNSRSAFLLLLTLGLSACTGQAATEPTYTGTRIHDLQGVDARRRRGLAQSRRGNQH